MHWCNHFFACFASPLASPSASPPASPPLPAGVPAGCRRRLSAPGLPAAPSRGTAPPPGAAAPLPPLHCLPSLAATCPAAFPVLARFAMSPPCHALAAFLPPALPLPCSLCRCRCGPSLRHVFKPPGLPPVNKPASSFPLYILALPLPARARVVPRAAWPCWPRCAPYLRVPRVSPCLAAPGVVHRRRRVALGSNGFRTPSLGPRLYRPVPTALPLLSLSTVGGRRRRSAPRLCPDALTLLIVTPPLTPPPTPNPALTLPLTCNDPPANVGVSDIGAALTLNPA